MNEEQKGNFLKVSGDELFLILYTLLVLPLTLALMWGAGELEPDAVRESWEKRAGIWVSKTPSGLTKALYEPSSKELSAYEVFVFPRNDEVKQKIVSIFQLKKRRPAADDKLHEVVLQVADSSGAFRVYDWENVRVRFFLPGGKTPVFIVPYLLELADGRLIFCPDDVNSHQNRAGILYQKPPYPHYPSEWPRLLTIPAWVEAVFPSLFCCMGWLWIQRRSPQHPYTGYICLVLPMLGAACLPVIYLHWHGCYEGGEAVAGMGLMAILNMLACLVLLSVTGCVRLLYRVARHDAAGQAGNI